MGLTQICGAGGRGTALAIAARIDGGKRQHPTHTHRFASSGPRCGLRGCLGGWSVWVGGWGVKRAHGTHTAAAGAHLRTAAFAWAGNKGGGGPAARRGLPWIAGLASEEHAPPASPHLWRVTPRKPVPLAADAPPRASPACGPPPSPCPSPASRALNRACSAASSCCCCWCGVAAAVGAPPVGVAAMSRRALALALSRRPPAPGVTRGLGGRAPTPQASKRGGEWRWGAGRAAVSSSGCAWAHGGRRDHRRVASAPCGGRRSSSGSIETIKRRGRAAAAGPRGRGRG